MITAAMTVVIGASRARVWRAITDPAEMIRWDERVLSLFEADPEYPRPGLQASWRYRLGSIPILLHDRTLEIKPGERLRSAVALGLFHFDQSWSLAGEHGDSRTRAGLRLAAENSVPVLGDVVDRFDVRRIATDYVDTRLRALRQWCEEAAN